MKNYLAIPLVYFAVGALWIVVSDGVVERVAPSMVKLTGFQTLKGWSFVLLTSFVLAGLLYRGAVRERKTREKADALFHETVSGAHHILGNYLNEMQVVTMEAERHASFDRQILGVAREATAEAAEALTRLEGIAHPDPAAVRRVVDPVAPRAGHPGRQG